VTGPTRFGSGGPFEGRFGYSRVVRTGPLVVTAGCTSMVDGMVQHPGDAAAQTSTAIAVGLAALARVGAKPGDVIQSRIFIADAALAEQVGAAHGAVFREIRPVATMVVAALIDPEMLVEVELVAWTEEPPVALDQAQEAGSENSADTLTS